MMLLKKELVSATCSDVFVTTICVSQRKENVCHFDYKVLVLLLKKKRKKYVNIASPTGNQSLVSRPAGGHTNQYITEDKVYAVDSQFVQDKYYFLHMMYFIKLPLIVTSAGDETVFCLLVYDHR